MKVLSQLGAVVPLLASALAQQTQWPVHNDGLTDIIQWDHYSPMINGERLFVWSGEIHYWRIPVPEVWRDLLEKVKAGGFNTVSIYAHWGFHQPNPTTVDFTNGARDITPLFTIAKEVGLYILFRGGPYVNAETTAGGFALWLTTGAYGGLRDNDPRYTAAWEPFVTGLNKILAENTITKGGPVLMQQIENEICCQYNSDGSLDLPVDEYMAALENNTRAQGVDVPLFVNAPNQGTQSFSTDFKPGLGTVDIYGVDSYPACWSCNLAECGSSVPEFSVVNYHDHFNLISPTQPSFIPEFQGGSYNPWSGPQGGCTNSTGPDFVNVFYRHLAAERLTMASLYMLYGGSNWGGFATNLVGTSYDYSAPIQETRQIADKFAETKLLGLFFRTAKDLRMTDRFNFSTSYTTSATVGATELRNPSNGAGFYVLRHSDSADKTLDTFKANINTASRGNLTVPQFATGVTLNGRQSKFLVTDFSFGTNSLVYSTAEILSHSVVDGRSVLALWLPAGEKGEFSIKNGSKLQRVMEGGGTSFHTSGKDTVVAFTQQKTQTVVQFDSFTAVLLPRELAYRFWAPTLTNSPLASDGDVLHVAGPYLVRSATIKGSQAVVAGDQDAATTIEVWAPKAVTSIVWNGKSVAATRTSYGTLKAKLPVPALTAAQFQSSIKLGAWKFSSALPEKSATYDDTRWTVANHTTTSNPTAPKTLPVLYSDDYGFHTGGQIFRGRFSGNNVTGASISIEGGSAFGWSAWLNGGFVGGFTGNSSIDTDTRTLSFSDATVATGQNVLVIVMDHSGHDQRSSALNPRGILGASLVSSDGSTSSTTFSRWTTTGNAGGTSNLDPIRGVINEGGLHAERLGWHLPGFDDSAWTESTPAQGVSGADIGFFRTTLDLNIQKGYDASLEFILGAAAGSQLRALLFVNGYQYGKFVPQVGNQITFPVPPGILNYQGTNTIGLSLWSQSSAGAKVDISVKVAGVYESSFDPTFDASRLQPGWTSARLGFA